MQVRSLSCALAAAVGLGAMGLSLLMESVEAIPAFARKYQTSCQTCHVAFPKLNAFGEAFRNNGYRFPKGDEEVVKEKPVSLGAPAWKRVWPRAVWPSDIPSSPPLALVVSNRFDVRPDDVVNNEFLFPNEVELFSGGTFGEDLSFYASLTLLEQNEFGGLHRLFGQFDSLWGTNLFNVKFGGFEPRAVPFSSHRKLLKTNYLVNNLQAGLDAALGGELEPGHGHGGSTAFALGSSQRGIELWGANSGPRGGGLQWAFGVVNGNGLGGVTILPQGHGEPPREGHPEGMLDEGHEDEHEEGEVHALSFLDNNSSKDIYWRASYKFFGMGLTGKSESDSSQVRETDNWVDDSFRIGTFGVRGRSRMGPDLADDEDYLRYGVDFDLWFRDLNLFGAYMWGHNERSSHEGLLEFDSNSWFAEADYVLLPWVIPAVRYEVAGFDPVLRGGTRISDSLPTIRRWVPHVTLLLRANVKLVFEANLYPDDFAGNLYRVDLDFAF